MVKFVQVGGHLFIGDLQKRCGTDMLVAPRLVIMVPIKPNIININFIQLIGEPKEIEIYEKLYSYDVSNSELLARYIEVTTDLILSTSGSSLLKEKMN